MTAQNTALKKLKVKHYPIPEPIGFNGVSARSHEIRRTNARVAKDSLRLSARSRHERKHGHGKHTTLQEHKEYVRGISKE